MTKFSSDQAIKFMGVPEAQRLWDVSHAGMMPNGKPAIDERLQQFKGSIVIDDSDHMTDSEYQQFVERFIIVVRDLLK